ncbi:MAG: FIG028593: membrane protein [uncultured Nocardioides sp.]|uniref:FIG028593: membrane protein n=1 Tax=uncultured Nocardioides sp. TaxID=198441 RepID=A0A6J4MWL1_9ACTN|nr:MAG: FIG028593: membrane protein [uncultured Nocardioides sp.]
MGNGRFFAPDIGRHLLREEDEVVVDEVTHHWVAYLPAAAYGAVGLALVLWLPLVDADLGWLVLLVAGGLLTVASWKALGVHVDRFVITNMRVFRINGVLAQSLATMPLTRILDITVQKPLVGRLLGYGHFVFESAAQAQGLRDITFVGRPDERDLTIQRVVQRSGLRTRRPG